MPQSSELKSSANHKRSQSEGTPVKPLNSDHPPSQSSAPPAPTSKHKRRGRSTSKAAEAKIMAAIDAIMEYNNVPHRSFEQKWVISSSSLKRLTKSYQGVIQRVLDAREADIQQHHQAHGLGSRHNVRHGRAGIKIEQVIQLEPDSDDKNTTSNTSP